MPRHLRIFLASPGGVANERTLARKVIERLPYDPLLRGKLTVEVVAWDKPGAGTPMLATMSPQEAIAQGLPKPSECDVVVVIFWARMGTPLPESWVKPEPFRYLSDSDWVHLHARYLSGTEWEFFDALKASEAAGQPDILVYRRTEEPIFRSSDPKMKENIEQWELVNAFFEFFRNPDGSIRRGYNEYDAPAGLERELENHLKSLIKKITEAPQTDTKQAVQSTAPTEAPLWQGSPFPGLRAFTDQDAPIFFGRGRETGDLLHRLADPANRFIAVVGASGSGKSSLVWAGLIPRLNDGAIVGSQDWSWARFTPGELGDNPFLALADSLKRMFQKQGWTVREAAQRLHANAEAMNELVQRALENRPDWSKLLLFIDQLEELFTLVNPDFRGPFINSLAHMAQLARVRIVVTMRADFYHRCLNWDPLTELLRTGSYPLATAGIGALHEMITRPAERAGLRFETGLAERILDDTGTEAGALALMAFALAELYQARTPEGNLTHGVYEDFQGVHGAIGKRAEDAFKPLEPHVQETLGDVFRELVEVDEHGTATRRRATIRRVNTSESATELVGALTEARLLVTSRGEKDEPLVEVAHEALFKRWPRIEDWIEKTGDDLRLRRQVGQAASEWRAHEHAEEYRWPDERVVEVIGMLARLGFRPDDLSAVERDFLGPIDRVRMPEELNDPVTSHERRAAIGVRLDLLGDDRPGVGLRRDGLPDIVWCQVPGGEVTLEENTGTFPVESFHISKYPVTWMQYQAFLEAPDGFINPDWWRGLWFQVDKPARQFNRRGNHPAENLCWIEAVAFCRWMSARLGHEIRLPTEWEWQQAATGGDPANQWPWGPDWYNNRANTTESELNRSTAVGMYPQGASSLGVFDMSGNVWEWCINEYQNPERVDLSGEARRVVRGGSWHGRQGLARASSRRHFVPSDRYNLVGFRLGCVSPIV